jgi:hypothetical protein
MCFDFNFNFHGGVLPDRTWASRRLDRLRGYLLEYQARRIFSQPQPIIWNESCDSLRCKQRIPIFHASYATEQNCRGTAAFASLCLRPCSASNQNVAKVEIYHPIVFEAEFGEDERPKGQQTAVWTPPYGSPVSRKRSERFLLKSVNVLRCSSATS